MKRRFADLGPQEVLALALDVERCNTVRFEALADMFVDYDVELRRLFLALRDDEVEHAAILERTWKEHFGDTPMPEIREGDVTEVVEAVDVEHGEHAIFDDMTPEDALRIVQEAERAAQDLYERAILATEDEELRKVYERLLEMEQDHAAAVEERKATLLGAGQAE